ncbi:unnamed protein product [Discula destructiva]
MSRVLGEIKSKLLEARQSGNSDQFDSKELIGDLKTVAAAQLTKTATSIKNIILGNESGETNEAYGSSLPLLGSAACRADTCCVWQYIAYDMTQKFRGESGRCTDLARGAVRLGFHDAAGWSKPTDAQGGGADGSIILAAEEMQRPENNGLQEIVAQMKTWYASYKSYGITMADLIQTGANVATVVCPLGPRVRTFVGRKDSSKAAPDGLLPPVTGTADFLIRLFQAKTIEPHGLTALLGAHTTSQQRFVDTSRAGDPQDSTPGVWDVLYYAQTLATTGLPPRLFKFQSDVNLAADPRISAEFKRFAGNGGQNHWNEDYAREYVRLSLLGVYNINKLTECSKALPPQVASFKASDSNLLDKWMLSTAASAAVAQAVLDGKKLDQYAALIDQLLQQGGGIALGNGSSVIGPSGRSIDDILL